MRFPLSPSRLSYQNTWEIRWYIMIGYWNFSVWKSDICYGSFSAIWQTWLSSIFHSLRYVSTTDWLPTWKLDTYHFTHTTLPWCHFMSKSECHHIKIVKKDKKGPWEQKECDGFKSFCICCKYSHPISTQLQTSEFHFPYYSYMEFYKLQ